VRLVTDVIVLNGGSSAGKSSLARSLQELLDRPWVVLGTDVLLSALAPSLVGDAAPRRGRRPLLTYGADGAVHVDSSLRPVETAWLAGIVAMAKAGLGVILEEVLLDGGAGQRRLTAALTGLSTLWVGVRCDPAAAAAREQSRSDRIAGMAISQAAKAHDGVRYDVDVNTTATPSEDCARTVLPHVTQV
jgi:chloramphenicol 3-O phosphotransferase